MRRLTRPLLSLMMGMALASADGPAGADPLFASPPLSDQELAEARGGFDLPNGMKIDFGILMRTSMNGVAILETTLQVIGDTVKKSVQAAVGTPPSVTGASSAQAGDGRSEAAAGSASAQAGQGAGAGAAIGDLAAQAGPDGATATAGTVVVGGSQAAGVEVTIGGLHAVADHAGAQVENSTVAGKASVSGGATLSLAGTAPAATAGPVASGSAGTPVSRPPAGSSANPPAGSANIADAGSTIVTLNDAGLVATTQLPQMLVRHEIGRQISSLVVNTADGRMVDSQLMINLQLDDVQPLALGSAGFRVEGLGLDAAIWRATGG